MRGIADSQFAAQAAPDGDYDAAECVAHLSHIGAASAGRQAVLDRAAAACGRAWAANVAKPGRHR